VSYASNYGGVTANESPQTALVSAPDIWMGHIRRRKALRPLARAAAGSAWASESSSCLLGQFAVDFARHGDVFADLPA